MNMITFVTSATIIITVTARNWGYDIAALAVGGLLILFAMSNTRKHYNER